MKGKIFLLAAIALFLTSTAIAQPKEDRNQTKRIIKALALDNRQAEEFTRVYTLYKNDASWWNVVAV